MKKFEKEKRMEIERKPTKQLNYIRMTAKS
jgi:hypothetical protein